MERKYKALTIFLTLFSAVLAVYIGTQVFSLYSTHKNASMSIARPSIDCVGMSYSISNISYDGYELRFDMKNNDDSIERIPSVMVKGVNERSAEFSNFLPRTKRHVVISDIKVADNFTVYPDNCATYAKRCHMATGSCEGILG